MSFPKQLPTLTPNCLLRFRGDIELVEADDLTMTLERGKTRVPLCPLLAPVAFEAMGMNRFSALAFADIAPVDAVLTLFRQLYGSGLAERCPRTLQALRSLPAA